MPLDSCTGVTGHRNPPGTRKPWTIAHENGQKCEITSFDDAARVVYGGQEASKSTLDPKTVEYSPRKRTDMREITNFGDAARVMYRGSRGIEILSGPEKRGL